MKYKGFEIKEIYQSADGHGRHDYSIKPAFTKNALTIQLGKPELGEVQMNTTLEKIKELIDKR